MGSVVTTMIRRACAGVTSAIANPPRHAAKSIFRKTAFMTRQGNRFSDGAATIIFDFQKDFFEIP